MSATALIGSMENLLKLHKSLLELAINKAEILKKGDMKALHQFMLDEQTHIAAIGKVETERLQVAKGLVPRLENPTIADCIERLTGDDQQQVTKLREELLETIAAIQTQNELNQQLLHQSLQFVNLSISLFTPPEPEDFLYGRKTSAPSSGLFNSKA